MTGGGSGLPEPATLLALDFGLRRIGVASATTLTGSATPLGAVAADAGAPRWETLDRFVSDWQPDLIVLGLPYNSDGSESDMTARVRSFRGELEARYDIAVATMDERYSSAEAETILKQRRQAGLKNKKLTREDVDSLAAAIIAESWMRENLKRTS